MAKDKLQQNLTEGDEVVLRGKVTKVFNSVNDAESSIEFRADSVDPGYQPTVTAKAVLFEKTTGTPTEATPASPAAA
mgnify:CR=1 FL=1